MIIVIKFEILLMDCFFKKNKTMKLYFDKEQDFCYPLEYWKNEMIENGIKELVLYEAKREIDNEYFYCKKVFDFGEKGQCGISNCQHYEPKNKIKGICKHYGFTYYATNKTKILKNLPKTLVI